MRILLSVVLFLNIFNVFGFEPNKTNVRNLFVAATLHEDSCIKLIKILQPFSAQSNSVYAGYKASATILMASFSYNPISKYNYFSSGKQLLENAILVNRNNVELRFLRFLIQTNCPQFLNYNINIQTDKDFILNNLFLTNDGALRKFIADILVGSKYISVSEKKNLKQWTNI